MVRGVGWRGRWARIGMYVEGGVVEGLFCDAFEIRGTRLVGEVLLYVVGLWGEMMLELREGVAVRVCCWYVWRFWEVEGFGVVKAVILNSFIGVSLRSLESI